MVKMAILSLCWSGDFEIAKIIEFIKSEFVFIRKGIFVAFTVMLGVVVGAADVFTATLPLVVNGGVVTFPRFWLFSLNPSSLLNGMREITQTAMINNPRIKVFIVNLYIRRPYFYLLFILRFVFRNKEHAETYDCDESKKYNYIVRQFVGFHYFILFTDQKFY
jgi:hypothetical protein